jgi:hypothetical protein
MTANLSSFCETYCTLSPALGKVLHFPVTARLRGSITVLRPPRAAHPRRRAYAGGGTTAAFIVPPPRRRASPAQKTNRRGLLSPLHCVTLRSQTRPSTAQRGRDSPLPVVGGRKVEKNANVMFAFFSSPSASVPPRRCSAAAGRTLPARLFVLPSCTAQ